MAQTFSTATWINIDISHKEFTFDYGIHFQMALHTMFMNISMNESVFKRFWEVETSWYSHLNRLEVTASLANIVIMLPVPNYVHQPSENGSHILRGMVCVLLAYLRRNRMVKIKEINVINSAGIGSKPLGGFYMSYRLGRSWSGQMQVSTHRWAGSPRETYNHLLVAIVDYAFWWLDIGPTNRPRLSAQPIFHHWILLKTLYRPSLSYLDFLNIGCCHLLHHVHDLHIC